MVLSVLFTTFSGKLTSPPPPRGHNKQALTIWSFSHKSYWLHLQPYWPQCWALESWLAAQEYKAKLPCLECQCPQLLYLTLSWSVWRMKFSDPILATLDGEHMVPTCTETGMAPAKKCSNTYTEQTDLPATETWMAIVLPSGIMGKQRSSGKKKTPYGLVPEKWGAEAPPAPLPCMILVERWIRSNPCTTTTHSFSDLY